MREDIGPYQEDFRTYDFSGFDYLKIAAGAKVHIRQGSSYSIMVRGDRRNLDDLGVRVQGSTLVFDYVNYRKRKYANEYTITMPTLKGFEFSGATHSEIIGFNNLSALEIRLSGASTSNFEGEAQQITAHLSGASRLSLIGKTKFLTVEASGGAEVQAYALASARAQVKVSGGSEARISVSQNLSAEATGGSQVRYRGNPTVSSQTSGGGSVIREL
ncbi:MAG: DUF2807 domain-containing protein [Microscillaceae bacterium]|nr:DUF2807 domain-containing protein [Microscillaceae bacterium]